MSPSRKAIPASSNMSPISAMSTTSVTQSVYQPSHFIPPTWERAAERVGEIVGERAGESAGEGAWEGAGRGQERE